MKSNDQKRLEVLYEQVLSNTDEFALLPEEEKYFETVIDFYFNRFKTNPRINEFMRTSPLNAVLVVMLNGYERPAPFSQFCKNGLGSEEKAINSFYNTNVLGLAESFIHLKKLKANDGKNVLAFNFLRLNNSDPKIKPIPLTETETIRKNLKESLINSLKSFVFPTRTLKVEDEVVWFNWRKKEAQLQGVRKKLPEIEGIF